MTLPHERLNALKITREFLRDLLNPKKIPRLTREVRRTAYYCLKHFPGDMDLDYARLAAPEIWGSKDEEIERILRNGRAKNTPSKTG